MRCDKLLRKQRGLTFLSIFFILFLIAFFTLLVLKILPIYMDHNKVMNVFSALKEIDGVENLSKREVENTINKRFNVNYVDHISLSDLVIVKKPHYLRVDLEYERVVPIVGNLSVLAEFSDSVEAGTQ